MLDDAPETVAMGGNQHPFPLFDLWDDLLLPEGQRSGDGILQTLTAGQLVISQVSITSILKRKHKLMLSMMMSAFVKEKDTMLCCSSETSPCWWSDRSHAPHPWVGEEYQKSASRSWPGPLRVWLLFRPCSAQSGHHSGAHWGARSGGQAATSGRCRPEQTTGCGWPS